MSNCNCNCNCNSGYLLLCFARFSPTALEITSLILCIIGGIATYFGLLGIPFHIDSNIYKIFFFINIPYFIIMIILNVLFLAFRYKDLIKNELYLWGYGLSILEIYVALFGVITSLINDSIIISNMRFYEELSLRKNSSKFPKIKPTEWLYTKIVLPIILFIWFNMLLMSLSDNLLINLKISGSYNTYERALEDGNKSDNYRNNSNENEEPSTQSKMKRKKKSKKKGSEIDEVCNSENEKSDNPIKKDSFITKIKRIFSKIKIPKIKLKDDKNKIENNLKDNNTNINDDKNINNNIINNNDKDKINKKKNEVFSSYNALIINNNMNENLKNNEERKS